MEESPGTALSVIVATLNEALADGGTLFDLLIDDAITESALVGSVYQLAKGRLPVVAWNLDVANHTLPLCGQHPVSLRYLSQLFLEVDGKWVTIGQRPGNGSLYGPLVFNDHSSIFAHQAQRMSLPPNQLHIHAQAVPPGRSIYASLVGTQEIEGAFLTHLAAYRRQGLVQVAQEGPTVDPSPKPTRFSSSKM